MTNATHTNNANETIGRMAARFRMHDAHAPSNARPLPLRYGVAARIFDDNVDAHPEIARMTWADCADFR